MANTKYKIITCNGYENRDASQYKTVADYTSVTAFATALDAIITYLNANKITFNLVVECCGRNDLRYAYIELFED